MFLCVCNHDETLLTCRFSAALRHLAGLKQSGGGEPVTVDYGMEKTDDGWKVYNVKIGGISLVENYRGTFNTEIQKNGVDGLIKTLREKNRALVAQTK